MTAVKARTGMRVHDGHMVSPASHVLVVAPDADLRYSLAFMLKAEGFDVETSAVWPPAHCGAPFDAVVIDHTGLDRSYASDAQLTGLGRRAIILASHPEHFPVLRKATLVRKPLLDHTLLNALREALAA